MKLVIDSIEKDLSEDFYTVDLNDAYASLGEIIGEEVAKIYSKNVFSIEDKTEEMIKDINEVIEIKEGEE